MELVKDVDPEKYLLIAQLPYILKTSNRQERLQMIQNELLDMKKSGVIVIDGGLHLLLVPKNTEIKVIDKGEEI